MFRTLLAHIVPSVLFGQPFLGAIGAALGSAAGWSGIGTGLVSGALSFLGGERRNRAQQASARESMQFEADQAQINRDFQERMSSTAHQRQIADLEAAGLNPILSARYGGSSTPGGATARGAQAQIQDTLSPAVSTALGEMSEAGRRQVVKQEAKNLADTGKQIRATTQKTEAETWESKSRTRVNEAIINKAQLEMLSILQNVTNAAQTENLLKLEGEALRAALVGKQQSAELLEKMPQLKVISTILEALGLSGSSILGSVGRRGGRGKR